MKHLNFILILMTVTVLAIIGVIFIIATAYSSAQPPEWTGTSLYQAYLDRMNVAVIPFVIALLVVLGVCIPKRLFTGAALLKINGVILLVTGAASVAFSAKTGLGLLLSIAASFQLVVIGLTAGGSKKIHFERPGFFLQIGSACLHLGLVIFLFDFLILLESPSHLVIFWVATALIGVGMILSFYSQEFSKAIGKKSVSIEPAPKEA